ncbi:MAG: acyl-CoA dehydrogenase [Candidatus Marinimicrobia bacterium]|nr:acyl-CoA dehydrogenase [Candidatus Neomarinimicrobiota bacterium]
MMLLNPKTETFDQFDPHTKELLLKTVRWFEAKGKQKIKDDDHERVWYADFLDFVKQEKLFATFLTHGDYGNENSRWDTYRNVALNEIFGFYGLAYWYTWQVTVLGLGPIWISKNDYVKNQTAHLLDKGEIFAFGLSEKEHGADIYASDMMLKPQPDGTYLAEGDKYYIGNGNEAALVSTFGRIENTDDYVFFVVNPNHDKYECVQNICNSQNYVAEFNLNDYPISEGDILAKGRDAWDMSLNTVNVGKYNLGWASIGMCSHAFYEALNHAAHRNLFKHTVTDFTHIKQLFVDAYSRLTAMKLFALRASDYMRAASPKDRRYLLYNPTVKMKVTMQGEEVINLLWDVIAAKGFEKDMFFEMAARDIRALPKLEGTIHVNMALIIKFMANYFFRPKSFPETPLRDEPSNDDFLFNQGATKGLGKIKFHDYRLAYNSVDLPNIRIVKKQIATLKKLLLFARPNKEQIKDFDFLLNLGELFTLVVYGQLIIEKFIMDDLDHDLLDQIFDFIIRDFSKYALILYSKTSSTTLQKFFCKRILRKPTVNPERFNRVLNKHVYSLTDMYEMKL